MKPSHRARKKADLADSTHQRLNMYTLAAGAAGVGLVAIAQPAQANIVYTRAHTVIGASTFLDLNHDGINDFQFITTHVSRCAGVCTTTPGLRHPTAFNSQNGKLGVYGVGAGNIVSGRSGFASALRVGAHVGPGGRFTPGGNEMAHVFAASNSYGVRSGPWAGSGPGLYRFLGFKFLISGRTHFGWARVKVTFTNGANIQALLTDYAYETVPNRPLITGQKTGPAQTAIETSPATFSAPASQAPSLGLLALGSQGLSIWRRKESEEEAVAPAAS